VTSRAETPVGHFILYRQVNGVVVDSLFNFGGPSSSIRDSPSPDRDRGGQVRAHGCHESRPDRRRPSMLRQQMERSIERLYYYVPRTYNPLNEVTGKPQHS
jgi:hypothetical protein